MIGIVGPSLFSGNSTSAIDALGRALDAAALRQETVAANLANVSTPGYHRKDVAFAPLLDERLGRDALPLAGADPLHFSGEGAEAAEPPSVITDSSGAMRLDGNNVDPDAEAARLAETEITFAALTHALSAQFAGLRIAITGSARG